MPFPISSSLLDAIVLSIVAREDTYGYRITQDVRQVMEVSDSTLYPVLRRLLKDGCLTTHPPLLPYHPARAHAPGRGAAGLGSLPRFD